MLFTKLEGPFFTKVKGRHYYLKHWIFPKETDAIALYPFVIHKSRYPTLSLIAHEEVHIAQVIEKGFIKFYFSYLWDYIKKGIAGIKEYGLRAFFEKGYWDNKYEVDARGYVDIGGVGYNIQSESMVFKDAPSNGEQVTYQIEGEKIQLVFRTDGLGKWYFLNVESKRAWRAV